MRSEALVKKEYRLREALEKEEGRQVRHANKQGRRKRKTEILQEQKKSRLQKLKEYISGGAERKRKKREAHSREREREKVRIIEDFRKANPDYYPKGAELDYDFKKKRVFVKTMSYSAEELMEMQKKRKGVK